MLSFINPWPSVVDVDCLSALDGLLWLRTGHSVAKAFNRNQSWVSRQSRKCADIFEVSLVRSQAEWCLDGDLTLLNLERNVHQHVRWHQGGRLRLEAQHWSGQLLCTPAPPGWVAGNFNFLEYHRPLQLLRDGVIDAWIASYPDLPDPEDPEIACLPLSCMPMHLVVREGHPLLDLGDQVGFADVAAWPLLPLPDQAFPKFQRVLADCGLDGATHAAMGGSSPPWLGNAELEALLVGFATPLALPQYGDGMKVLPLCLPVEVGDALLVPREYGGAPQTLALADRLRQRLHQLAANQPDVVVLEAGAQPSWGSALAAFPGAPAACVRSV